MKLTRKQFWRLLIAYALVLVFVYPIPQSVHSQDFDRAFFAWYKNPTPESAAALRVQQHKIKVTLLVIDAVGAFVLVAMGYGVYSLVRLILRLARSDRHPSA